MDCYMYQTVGSEMVDAIAECLNLPLFKKTLSKKPVNLDLEYKPDQNDEVEDLFDLIVEIKVILRYSEQIPNDRCSFNRSNIFHLSEK